MPHGGGGGSGKSSDTYNSQNALEEPSARSGPYFDKSASKNVTALLGKTTYLNCRVKNLGNKTVSRVYPRARARASDLSLSLVRVDTPGKRGLPFFSVMPLRRGFRS